MAYTLLLLIALLPVLALSTPILPNTDIDKEAYCALHNVAGCQSCIDAECIWCTDPVNTLGIYCLPINGHCRNNYFIIDSNCQFTVLEATILTVLVAMAVCCCAGVAGLTAMCVCCVLRINKKITTSRNRRLVSYERINLPDKAADSDP